MNWDEAVEQLLAREIESWTDSRGRTYTRQHALNVLGYDEAKRRGLLRDYLESRSWGRRYLATLNEGNA